MLVEADGTYVRMRDGPAAEAEAVVAYAGKERRGRRTLRSSPVRLGCVGEAPGDFWGRAVAQVGRRHGLARVERAGLGTDGEAQYVNGLSRLRFPEATGHLDPFHVFRAVGRCAPPPHGEALVALLRSGGPEACAEAVLDLVDDGVASEGAGAVASYLRRHAAEIGGGPSMGTMEAEQQHVYKVRMASFPCAWSPAGADAMARVRGWLRSGFELPARTRGPPARRAAPPAGTRGSRGSSPRSPGPAHNPRGRGGSIPSPPPLPACAPTSGTRARAGRWGRAANNNFTPTLTLPPLLMTTLSYRLGLGPEILNVIPVEPVIAVSGIKVWIM